MSAGTRKILLSPRTADYGQPYFSSASQFYPFVREELSTKDTSRAEDSFLQWLSPFLLFASAGLALDDSGAVDSATALSACISRRDRRVEPRVRELV